MWEIALPRSISLHTDLLDQIMQSATLTRSRKAVVLLSGGLDSMVCAALAREAGHDLHALTIDYGQRHKIEIDASRVIAQRLGASEHCIVEVDLRRFGGSALTDEIDVPKSGYDNGIPVTYVPARNLLFLSLALSWAETIEASEIYIGINAIDYSGYPDCRPEFIQSFSDVARLATKTGTQGDAISIRAPLQYLSKAEIALEAKRLGLDPGLSWSCYDPEPDGRACGICDSCRLRKAGFASAGWVDGVKYAC